MSLIFHIVLGALLIVAFYEDWKFRAITWLVFPAVGIVTLLIFILPGGDWKVPGSNLIFVLIIMTALTIWVSVRERKPTNIFKKHFGIGDLLFFIAILPLFGCQNFVLFFISGMMLSCLVHIGVTKKTQHLTIPLAGYLAVYVLLLKSASLVLNVDLFHITFLV